MLTPIKYIVAFLILAAGLFSFLAFGDPQKCKWRYFFQEIVMSRNFIDRHHLEPNVPHKFTGVWRNYIDGFVLETTYIAGKKMGLQKWVNGDAVVRIIKHGELDYADYEMDIEDRSAQPTVFTSSIVIYDPLKNIDRRAEFGIEVE